jgi:CRISPR-associated protein Cas1
MSTLYLIEPGSRLEKEYGRLLVTKDDEVLLRVPISRVSQVVFVGRVGATTAALQALLNAEIPLLLVNRSGNLRGRLLGPTPANLPLRQEQYRRNDDPDFCLRLARQIASGKIRNQRTLALRLARRHAHIDPAFAVPLAEAFGRAAAADDLATLLGIEGQAARLYFGVYRQAFAGSWAFDRRTRRPPTDPVNALLSLGYTFLTQGAMTALEIVGLDPYLGYFHSETYGRPALALDLVEEFRAPIVDSLVLSLINHHLLQEKDFQAQTGRAGVLLTTAGLRTFLRKYSDKLESEVLVRDLGRTISYRKLLEVQARRVARVIRGDETEYRAFRAR